MKFLFVSFVLVASMICPATVHAQAIDTPDYAYEVGRIVSIKETAGAAETSRDVSVRMNSGVDKDRIVTTQYVFDREAEKDRFHVGDEVVMYGTTTDGATTYYIAEEYRIPQIVWVVVIFMLLVIATTQLRGIYAFVGLIMSGVVITQGIVPQILAGHNPFVVAVLGALVILCVSVFTAHGFRPRTVIAILSMMVTILCAVGASYLVVDLTQLTGLGSEEAFMVQFGFQNVNIQGLLLGGIIIGVLGVLDDVATAQVAAVEELYRANTHFQFRELFLRGFSVGKEHILSLVNTLVLAYAGASMPIFLLLTVSSQPWWVSLNSEPFAEEIVRALIGSMALIFAVPLTTVLAAYCYSRPWFRRVITD